MVIDGSLPTADFEAFGTALTTALLEANADLADIFDDVSVVPLGAEDCINMGGVDTRQV